MLKPFFYKDTIEVGLDEAGRGPLFGRVYVGAAILPQDDSFNHGLMKDSKKFGKSKKGQRELLRAYEYIKSNAIAWGVYWISEKDIDDINIYKATHKAWHKVIDNLNIVPENILVDGNKFFPYSHKGEFLPHICIKGGDNKYSPIAAASIIAKVERDNYIRELCKENPELVERYNIESNKGYGAKTHIDGIKKYGISKWHRKTFGICQNY